MIYHIAPKGQLGNLAAGSYAAESLDKEGFIHCSAIDQVEEVANAFYRDVDDLVILCIDESLLDAPLKWERSPDHDGLFPHVYGPIPARAIVKAFEMVRSEDGSYRIEKDKLAE